MQTINCEITKVFEAKPNGVGFGIRVDNMSEDLQEFVKNDKYPNQITVNWWFNKQPSPKWLIEGSKIKFSWYKNPKGYLTIDQASLEVLQNEGIELEDIEDDLDDSFDTDQLEAEALKDLEQNDKSNVTNLKPKAINNINSKKLSKIQELTDNYGDVFKVVNSHPNLVSLPLEEKTKITTHINITLSQQGY